VEGPASCHTEAMTQTPPSSASPTEVPEPSPYLQHILRARVYDVAIESPMDAAPNLSRRLGNRVLLKREDLQPVFSFKLPRNCGGA
jgi:threonine dehydratase